MICRARIDWKNATPAHQAVLGRWIMDLGERFAVTWKLDPDRGYGASIYEWDESEGMVESPACDPGAGRMPSRGLPSPSASGRTHTNGAGLPFPTPLERPSTEIALGQEHACSKGNVSQAPQIVKRERAPADPVGRNGKGQGSPVLIPDASTTVEYPHMVSEPGRKPLPDVRGGG